ncbi:dTDP-4-dehydrorhamnose 3,5-epimerase [Parafilimonas sp.]|uniref:dTDP-4-dehydrorhamnose 3,5-epimerase n=1 Tax=Parafilimonas sp. TaxID=1969739 RepID=UPI0039E2585D
MQIEATPLQDCYIIHDTVFADSRGYFFESFNAQKFTELTGVNTPFVQDNQSSSTRGVLRGLHAQTGEHAQAKLVRVLSGKVLDVAVDLRKYSPSFGKAFSIELTGDNHKQLYIPRGFAHGFVVLSDTAVFFYKCDNFYNKESELGILYNDPQLNINWQLPKADIILSEKDKNNFLLADVLHRL